MLTQLYRLVRPALFALAPEDAHEVALKSLEAGLYGRQIGPDDPNLSINVLGLTFPNPIGIAAGFDKDARVPDAVLALGCGFAEVGTITPRPQVGNERPRVFRLVDDEALINRLGFNNAGHEVALRRLASRPRQRGIVGVNIGANKDSADKAADYVAGLKAFNAAASYFTINISSPNTPGLRDLQAPAALNDLLTRVIGTRSELVAAGLPYRPIVVKISPDLAEGDLAGVCEQLAAKAIDGIAVSNTTLSRVGVTGIEAREAGGLSGRPLFQRSTITLARVHTATGGAIPLIGIGGIDSPEAAVAKLEAGASLLQLYTGLIFRGPGLIGEIKRKITETIRLEKLTGISDLVGRRANEWARREIS